MENNKVIVVDQTLDGLKLDMEKVHLILRPHRNLGFSKSMNEGVIHGLRWGAKYITCANDDIEYMDDRWWDGILQTFHTYGDNVMAVNPMSPREPGWGYGWEHGRYIDLLPYKEKYDRSDYDFLIKGDFSGISGLPDTFPRQKSGVIDAIATWHTTFKAESFEKVGFFDERFYPGGAEDYDMDGRAYRANYRMLGTTLSWVWHHWGSSKDFQEDSKSQSLPIIDSLRWADLDGIWPASENRGKKFDPWGKYEDESNVQQPMHRDPTVGIIEI